VSAKRTKRTSKKVPRRGRADLARIDSMTEQEIARTSPPELADLPEDFWEDAEVVTIPKEAISLRIDQDVLSWFREGGPRYQSRMNAVLRSYVQAMRLERASPRDRSNAATKKRSGR